MSERGIDVAIIGAGPYGLSVACHLKARGVKFRIFGSPMRFWRDMLKGSALKSPDFGTNIYTPKRGYRFVDYCRDRGLSTQEPIRMALFAEYGQWAQQQLVPEVEDVEVCRVTQTPEGFLLTLANGEPVQARRVVVAVGVRYFQNIPEELAELSPDVLTHTFERKDYDWLAGKDVTVIGHGQSAIEAAAFLHESGAATRMLVRGSGVWFANPPGGPRPLWDRIKNPQSVVGPGRTNRLIQEAGTLFHYVPEAKRVSFTKKYLGPFGSWWLREKIENKVAVHLHTRLVQACEEDGQVRLTVRDKNGEREFVTDHVVTGTGYVFAADRLPFLPPPLVDALDKIEKAPRLNAHFESSVPGLYFIGPIAAYSFGPLLRFVCGAEFAAPALARHLARTRQAGY